MKALSIIFILLLVSPLLIVSSSQIVLPALAMQGTYYDNFDDNTFDANLWSTVGGVSEYNGQLALSTDSFAFATKDNLVGMWISITGEQNIKEGEHVNIHLATQTPTNDIITVGEYATYVTEDPSQPPKLVMKLFCQSMADETGTARTHVDLQDATWGTPYEFGLEYTQTGEVKVWINGNNVYTFSVSGAASAYLNGGARFWLGADSVEGGDVSAKIDWTSATTRTDLQVSNIDQVQVLWNSDIDRDGFNETVSGKPMAVFVRLDDLGIVGLGDNQILKMKVLCNGVVFYNDSTTVSQYKETKYIKLDITPTGSGRQDITAIVDWDNSIFEIKDDNNAKTIQIDIVITRPLKVLFVPIDGTTTGVGYGNLDMFSATATVAEGMNFVSDVYPVNPTNVNYAYGNTIKGSADNTVTLRRNGVTEMTKGMQTDIVSLFNSATTLGYDYAVGIVPDGYFQYHLGVPKSGATESFTIGKGKDAISGKVILVTEGAWRTIAHELGHAYGNINSEEYKETNGKLTYEGNTASSGYNAQGATPINAAARCFMGTVGPGKTNTDYSWWVCFDTYRALFRGLS